MNAPAHYQPYASGVQTLPDPTVNTNNDPLNFQRFGLNEWTSIAQWKASTPQPCELALTCRYPSNFLPLGNRAYFPDPTVEFYTGQTVYTAGETWAAAASGAFFITYGREGLQRRLICDMRTSRIFLGVCGFVRVQAMRWATQAFEYAQGDVEVGADIGPAAGGQYDEPTATMTNKIPSGFSVLNEVYPPQNARWWVPMINPAVAGDVFWGTTTPDIQWVSAGQAFVCSAANYRWTPPLARFEISQGPSGASIRLTSNGALLTQDLWLGTRFYLST